LAGDKKYGGTPTLYAPGQLLHAWRLRVNGAGGTPAFYEAPPPEGFARCMGEWLSIKPNFNKII
jgi:hypothetical protein